MSLILALDLGTSSTRTALFDSHGHRLVHTTGQQSYPLIIEPAGAAELDPLVMKEALLQCLRRTMQQYRSDPALAGQPIAGAGISCAWHGVMGTDTKGRPLTRYITWADARPAADAAALREELLEKAVHARTGCMLRASFWPAKLTWLRRTEPALFRKVARWMSVAEWLQLELCGAANCAIGMATGTGMFDPTALDWDPALMERCRVKPERFLQLSDEPVATGRALAKEFPELAETKWFPAIGDGAASNLGSGATRPGYAAINVGTSAALRIMREGRKARAPFGLFAYRVDRERYLVGGAISNAGNLRAWCLRELRLEENPAALEKQLAERPAPGHGLVVLPFWTVERAPTWNEEQTGVIVGMTQTTTGLDLLQAITEASYHRIARIAELLLAGQDETPKFLVSGGIQHSPTAMQRMANVLGKTIYANPEPEASLRGAAVYALEKLGMPFPALKLGQPIRAQAKIARIYAAEREKQTALEARLSTRVH
jgi:gluconokinase